MGSCTSKSKLTERSTGPASSRDGPAASAASTGVAATRMREKENYDHESESTAARKVHDDGDYGGRKRVATSHSSDRAPMRRRLSVLENKALVAGEGVAAADDNEAERASETHALGNGARIKGRRNSETTEGVLAAERTHANSGFGLRNPSERRASLPVSWYTERQEQNHRSINVPTSPLLYPKTTSTTNVTIDNLHRSLALNGCHKGKRRYWLRGSPTHRWRPRDPSPHTLRLALSTGQRPHETP